MIWVYLIFPLKLPNRRSPCFPTEGDALLTLFSNFWPFDVKAIWTKHNSTLYVAKDFYLLTTIHILNILIPSAVVQLVTPYNPVQRTLKGEVGTKPTNLQGPRSRDQRHTPPPPPFYMHVITLYWYTHGWNIYIYIYIYYYWGGCINIGIV